MQGISIVTLTCFKLLYYQPALWSLTSCVKSVGMKYSSHTFFKQLFLKDDLSKLKLSCLSLCLFDIWWKAICYSPSSIVISCPIVCLNEQHLYDFQSSISGGVTQVNWGRWKINSTDIHSTASFIMINIFVNLGTSLLTDIVNVIRFLSNSTD